MVPKSGENFHRKLLTTVLGAPMLFFSTTDSGSIQCEHSETAKHRVDTEIMADLLPGVCGVGLGPPFHPDVIITMVPKSGENFHRKLLTTVLGAPMLFFSTTDSKHRVDTEIMADLLPGVCGVGLGPPFHPDAGE
jgi:uncharacterized membrane protein